MGWDCTIWCWGRGSTLACRFSRRCCWSRCRSWFGRSCSSRQLLRSLELDNILQSIYRSEWYLYILGSSGWVHSIARIFSDLGRGLLCSYCWIGRVGRCRTRSSCTVLSRGRGERTGSKGSTLDRILVRIGCMCCRWLGWVLGSCRAGRVVAAIDCGWWRRVAVKLIS